MFHPHNGRDGFEPTSLHELDPDWASTHVSITPKVIEIIQARYAELKTADLDCLDVLQAEFGVDADALHSMGIH